MRLLPAEEAEREQPAHQQRQLQGHTQRTPPGRRTHHAQGGTERCG
jgi:hypothetical protein